MGNTSKYIDDILSGSGNLFTFKNVNCETKIDITHDKWGNEIKTLRIKNTKNIQNFTYKAVEGLCHRDKPNNNLLAELFSIASNEINQIKQINNFFEEYGFFIPVSNESFEEFSYHDIYSIITRIRILVELIQELQKKFPDYNLLFEHTTRLQLANPIIISNEGKYTYKTYTHFLKHELESININQFDTLPDYKISTLDIIEGNYETGIPDARILDSMSPVGFTDIYIEEFIEEEDQYKFSTYFRNLFGICFDGEEAHRKIIELYYHIEDSSIMKLEGDNFDILETLQFSHRTDLNKSTYPNLQERIIEVAKITIKDEIEYALRNVKPSYDSDTFLGTWNIPDFLSALYFSIFYMRPDLQIFRLCENPYCNNYFLVTSTNSRRKYCKHECANAVSQRAYRVRKQQLSEEGK